MTARKRWRITLRCFKCNKEETKVISAKDFTGTYYCSCGGHRTVVMARFVNLSLVDNNPPTFAYRSEEEK